MLHAVTFLHHTEDVVLLAESISSYEHLVKYQLLFDPAVSHPLWVDHIPLLATGAKIVNSEIIS